MDNVLGPSDIYFIEKTSVMLEEQYELSEDMLAIVPSTKGMAPLRKKEDLSLEECAREISALVLNYYAAVMLGKVEYDENY